MNSQRLLLARQLILRLLIWTGCFLFFLSLVRWISFLLYALPHELTLAELAQAFFLGFRFDLSVACYVMVLPILILGPFLAVASLSVLRIPLRALEVYLTLMATVVVYLSVVDVGYYSFFQDHINIMIFGFFEDDTMALVRTFWRNYPVIWIFLGIFLSGFAAWKLTRRLFTGLSPLTSSPRRFSILGAQFVLLLILSLGARGSFGLFPLGVADATISTKPFMNYLAFSGLHSLHRAIKLKMRAQNSWNINEKNYGYLNMKSAAADFLQNPNLPDSNDPLVWLQKKTPRNTWAEKKRPHVVVLMMESMGGSWLNYDSKDFDLLGELRRHFHDDFLFMNFMPSMTATIGSLSTLMINTPHRPDGGFLTESRYLQVPFRTAPARTYNEMGYRTRFIYGGAVGWRDIDKFARAQGFASVEGDFEIEKKLGRKLERHDWGVFDEDLWTYLQSTLEQATSPEMVVVMTTTNHPPYQLPEKYTPLPLQIPEKLKARLNVDEKLAADRFRAFQYSNQKLGEFMTHLKSSPLADHTLVAATGDHGFLIVNFDETEQLQKWQVPLYLYIPSAARPAHVDLTTFGCHADIFPTLMPLSLSDQLISGIGVNLLDPQARHDAFHFSRRAFNAAGAIETENAEKTNYYTWTANQKLQTSPAVPALETLSKRYQSLMAFLDEFYEYERKNARGPHENSGR